MANITYGDFLELKKVKEVQLVDVRTPSGELMTDARKMRRVRTGDKARGGEERGKRREATG